ncbi:MAG: alpha-L-fucosidase [Eubacteriales bacterium]
MKKTWHDNAFFGLHFDIHAGAHDVNLGRDVTVEHLKAQFEKMRPDYVQCDCKGHPGYTSYPTKVGIASPGIVKDALRVWRQATRELGLPLIMHYSGVWDTAAIAAHPDFARVLPDKNEDGSDKLDPNNTCPLSDYTDKYLILQMEELLKEYDVDGFWVDGENWASHLCYCERCKKSFTDATGIAATPLKAGDEGWEDWLRISRENFTDHVRRYTAAIHAAKPTATSCSNWMYTLRQPEDITVDIDYISGDFTWIWSCANAISEARFMDSRGLKWDLMAWAFTSYEWGKQWEYKTAPALMQEAACVMSCGGAFTIYDTPNRTGNLVEWHMDELAKVSKFCRARKDVCFDTKTYPQAVVLHSQEYYYKHGSPLFGQAAACTPLEGALHLLLDNGIHTDILNTTSLLEKLDTYPMCVVPENDCLSPEVVSRLRDYVNAGGTLVVSTASVYPFADLLGIETVQTQVTGQYLPSGGGTTAAMGNWDYVKASKGTVLETILTSRDRGEYEQDSTYPAASCVSYGAGKIIAIYGELFSGYLKNHYPRARVFFSGLLEKAGTDNLIGLSSSSPVHLTARQKDGHLFLNLVNMSTTNTTSPTSPVIEDVPYSSPVNLSVPYEGTPKSITLYPEGITPSWSINDGKLCIHVERVGIMDIVDIEK